MNNVNVQFYAYQIFKKQDEKKNSIWRISIEFYYLI